LCDPSHRPHLHLPNPALTHPRTPRPLATDQVLYVGEPVALVVADSRYLAEDALESIEVTWQALPVVASLDAARAEGAPLVHADVPGNRAARLAQRVGDPDAVLAGAARVFRETLWIERSCGSPIATRGVVAGWDGRDRARPAGRGDRGPPRAPDRRQPGARPDSRRGRRGRRRRPDPRAARPVRPRCRRLHAIWDHRAADHLDAAARPLPAAPLRRRVRRRVHEHGDRDAVPRGRAPPWRLRDGARHRSRGARAGARGRRGAAPELHPAARVSL